MATRDDSLSPTSLAAIGAAVVVGCIGIGLWGSRRPRVETDPMLMDVGPAQAPPPRVAPTSDPEVPVIEDGSNPAAVAAARPEFELKEEVQADSFQIADSRLVLEDPNGEVIGSYTQLELDQHIVEVTVDTSRGDYSMDMDDGRRIKITKDIYEQLPSRFFYSRAEMDKAPPPPTDKPQ